MVKIHWLTNIGRVAALLLMGAILLSEATHRVVASESVVSENGMSYTTHTVASGDTIYSLTRTYDVTAKQLYEYNPTLRKEGLKRGDHMKIPAKKRALLRTRFDQHRVSAGETLYSISKHYGVSINTILDDNKALDPSQLKVGEFINIRRSHIGQTGKAEIEQHIEQYEEVINSSAPEAGYKYYVADNGETINIVAKRIGGATADGTEEFDLKAFITSLSSTPPLFSSLSSDERLNIALLLPLTINGKEMEPFAEFYKGFLLGVEELQEMEYDVTINLYDTQRSTTRIEYIMTEDNFLNCDLIVGPVFEDEMEIVAEYAKLRSIPVVSPLATLQSRDYEVVFQMSPDPTHRYDKISHLLNEENSITLIYSENNDKGYDDEIRELLDRQGVEYVIHSYKYEHPSVISDRNREAEEFIKEMERDAEEFGIVLDSSDINKLLPDLATSDLRPLVANKAKHNLFFIMSDNQTDVDRILGSTSVYTT